MSSTPASPSLPPDEFFERCLLYRSQLSQVHGLDEVQQLWASTQLPYTMPELDPLSEDYRRHVLAIYQRLTQQEYQVRNELTSTKQSAEDFQLGYPWVSRSCGVAASEVAKTVQALSEIAKLSRPIQSVVEFGSGWGNLSLPLTKLGLDVTAIDIDQGFLDRLSNHVEREGFKVQTFCGDFIHACRRLPRSYDLVIFQSSFHHCLEFDALLAALAHHVLGADGAILFLSEPIYSHYTFPWGLRFDGESLWAIMCNHWLELGFDMDFFLALLLRHGFFVRRVDGIAGFVGDGWMAIHSRSGIAFAECELPAPYALSFWERSSETAYGRFLRGCSALPALPTEASHYRLTLKNFCTKPLQLCLSGDGQQEVTVTLAPEMQQEIDSPVSHQQPLQLNCETVVPDRLIQNGDNREIGLALIRLATN
jgi:2-polyprenyl-3-methyl-5-hydroxy-6-metoxy-1,4-benzoquinol methylase